MTMDLIYLKPKPVFFFSFSSPLVDYFELFANTILSYIMNMLDLILQSKFENDSILMEFLTTAFQVINNDIQILLAKLFLQLSVLIANYFVWLKVFYSDMKYKSLVLIFFLLLNEELSTLFNNNHFSDFYFLSF